MKNRKIFFVCIILFSCEYTNYKTLAEKNYSEQVGDIKFDPKVDAANFSFCDSNNVFQYYNFVKGIQYRGEKIAIINYFKEKFNSSNFKTESGYLTVRFVVNCKGESGLFRIAGMNMYLKPKHFKDSLIQEILRLTKELDGWIVGKYENINVDYYQYLTFKIVQGRIIDIMP